MSRHLRDCIESVKFESVQDGIKLQNFKRQVEENPNAIIKSVKRQYRIHYSSTLKSLTWKNDDDRVYLYDNDCQQVRLVYEPGLKPLLIPPIGCKNIVQYNYCDEFRSPKLPRLTIDAWRSIFKFVPGWELLAMRLVCKKWNKILVGTPTLWVIHPTRFLDSWINLPPIEAYIRHMFLGIKNVYQIYRFFLRQYKFFIYICGLMLGHFNLNPIIEKDKIQVGGYVLTKDELTCNGMRMNIERFLDAYRQSIL